MVKQERASYAEMHSRARRQDFITPSLLSAGQPLSIAAAMEKIVYSGHGAIDPVEGAIWRVERKEKVDFLVKFVRHDKEDGKYFPEINEGKTTWNMDISGYLNQVT